MREIKQFDLHTHSAASDGRLKPAELINFAGEAGIGLALTDHDTLAGLDMAAEAARLRRLPFIPGIELTTDYGPYEVHILGLFIAGNHEELQAAVGRIKHDRISRAREMVKKLAILGFPVAWEEVWRYNAGGFIGRPHILRALLAKGLVPAGQGREFFQQYLSAGAPAYVPHAELTTAAAVSLALSAGGTPILAHPGRSGLEELIPELIDFGLAGIEAFHPAHQPEDAIAYARLAERYSLAATGGSDFHGEPGGSRLGQYATSLATVRLLAEQATSEAGRIFLHNLHVPGYRGE